MKPNALCFFTWLMITLLIGVVGKASGQNICTGNLGENIFEAGDFGSGASNLLPFDPGIAPGYTYTLSPPPNDGLYTITNNTGAFPFLFPGWMAIRDNSSDPNGYMMVVNASYAPGDFYDKTVDGLCDNTLYEFSADIFNLINAQTANFIKPNVSFLINDEVRYTTGNIPQNEIWNTFGFTFTTGPGETSVRLTLRNNAPGGIGNDLALDNISFRACGPAALILPYEIANICEDGAPITLEATIEGNQFPTPAVQWQQSLDGGMNWSDIPGATGLSIMHTQLSAGYYYYRYLLANSPSNLANSKCRIISNVKVVYVQPKFYSLMDTICQGNSYMVGGHSYTESGIFTDTLVSSIGCDSIVTLNLNVLPDLGLTAEVAVEDPSCNGNEDGRISISGLKNFYPPAVISLDEMDVTAEQATFSDLGSGVYLLTIRDRYGCDFSNMIEIHDPLPLWVSLGQDSTIQLGETVRLLPLANYPLETLVWEPEGQLICEEPCLAPLAQPLRSTTFYLTAATVAGCHATDSITIRVEEYRAVYIPNAFSPNDDGRNDYFTLFAAQPNVQEVSNLQIFDRWGGMVFERKNFSPNEPSLGWDGKSRDKLAPAGAYTYVFRVRFLDEVELLYTGAVHLLR